MFKCEICGTTVAAKTPAIRITLELREKSYTWREKIYPKIETTKKEDLNKRKRRKPKKSTKVPPLNERKEWRDDPGGRGYEIVREALACAGCAAKHHATLTLEGKSVYQKAV
jgi:ribosome-binding protein aMBF1 (putative translation factor)